MKKTSRCFLAVIAFIQIGSRVWAWDYPGHRAVNQIALASLPTNFPAFVKTPDVAERITFLAGEPDRWRNTPDPTFAHYNEPDHFIDIEFLTNFEMTAETVSPFRYTFVSQLAAYRVANPGVLPQANPTNNFKHTQEFFGFLPWTINEYFSKLRSEFSYLKTFEQFGGTPDEIQNAKENVIYTMGVMGHYVGDGSMPLHTTYHYNGWGKYPNPKNFTNDRNFHELIDGAYFVKVGIGLDDLLTNVPPATLITTNADGIFRPVINYITAQNQLVEPLYQLEKDGKLSGEGALGLEGKPFLQKQLVVGGQMLGSIWLTAWETSSIDDHLKRDLQKRNAPAQPPAK